MLAANLVILAQIYDKLLCEQAEFPRILSQNGQNDLESQGQWPPFSIPAESIPGYMFAANLVIPAQICEELSCGQGKVYRRTDGWRDGQVDRRRQQQYPFDLKGQGVKIISKLILVTDGYDISSEIALRWTSRDLCDDKSTLGQLMAWCRQATSHNLNQCWPTFLPPFGVTRPQWVNALVW